MKYHYESVTINEEIPMFLLMTNVTFIPLHWHDRIEILFVLKGKVRVLSGRKEYFLEESDLLLINHNEVHGVESGENNKVLVLQIPIWFIKKSYKNIEEETFHCQSFLHKDQENFNVIRRLIIQLKLILMKKEIGFDIKIHSLLLDMIYNLITYFRVKGNKQVMQKNEKVMERLTRIVNYVNDHFMHPITLNEVAEMENLSVPYLSKFFNQHMGKSFNKYINDIRLGHAVRYLTETNWTIIQIAMECGFGNLNSFHKVFRQTFHTTPYQYRKKKLLGTFNRTYHLSKKGDGSYVYNEEIDLNELEKHMSSIDG